jgi:hypothetical protein
VPFLVQWDNGGALVTLCAATVAAADLLPDHLALAGVKGLSDADYPLLEIDNLYVRRSDVVYVAEGRTIAAVQEMVAEQGEGVKNEPVIGVDSDLRRARSGDRSGDRKNNERIAQQNGEKTQRDREKDNKTNGVQKPSRRSSYRRQANESRDGPAC